MVMLAVAWCVVTVVRGAPEDDLLPRESDFYRILTVAKPDGLVLEVAGMLVLPDGRPMVSTRRGEVFIIDDARGEADSRPVFHRFADGLQEPLGLLQVGDWIYTAQRGELSRMRDTDGDDRVDEIETVSEGWPISGNYHEYAFGPRRDREGNFWVTLNKPFGDQPFGAVDWRGWAVRITPDGTMIPTSCGLRSPAGLERSPDGEMFYTDNQGEWCGASKLSHLAPGDFHGHPHGLPSCERPECPFPHPGDPPDGELMPEVARRMPTFRLPAVWFPYDKMGKSPSGFVWDQTEGRFGPFGGQVFVGDQHHAAVFRVFLERVEGHVQGACFPFRDDFQCGIIRVAFDHEGALLTGQSRRGWGSRGSEDDGLQRLVWTGRTPFEVLKVSARPEGFLLRFTQPAREASAADVASYEGISYTYKLHSEYGSPEVDEMPLEFQIERVSADGLEVELRVTPLREGYVHELHLAGIRSRDGLPLLHDQAYYTLVRRPR